MAAIESFQPERRRSFRCSAMGESEAVLRVGGKQFDVQIIDESRDGVGVLSMESPGAKEGDPVELKTSSGVIKLRIVKVRRFGSAYRVGMERTGEVPLETPKGSPWSVLVNNQQAAGHGATKTKLPSFAFGIWMAFGSMATFAALYWTLSGTGKRSQSHFGAAQDLAATSYTGPAAGSSGSDSVPRITSATPFSLVSAGEYLQLSEVQRIKILQIIGKATAAAPEIRRVSVTGSAAGLPPQAEARLNAAMVEALNVLDDSQRQRWRSLAPAN